MNAAVGLVVSESQVPFGPEVIATRGLLQGPAAVSAVDTKTGASYGVQPSEPFEGKV